LLFLSRIDHRGLGSTSHKLTWLDLVLLRRGKDIDKLFRRSWNACSLVLII
jgi:hypothetical protein